MSVLLRLLLGFCIGLLLLTMTARGAKLLAPMTAPEPASPALLRLRRRILLAPNIGGTVVAPVSQGSLVVRMIISFVPQMHFLSRGP